MMVTPALPVIEDGYKMPKGRKKRPAIPDNVAKAFKAYAEAYRVVYGTKPLDLEYDRSTHLASWRMPANVSRSAGASIQRIKELTRMLKERAKV